MGCDGCSDWGIYLDANFTHLFKARQCRTFDLYCKPLSRYMLATYFGKPVVNLIDPSEAPPIKQFKDVYTPVANLTTFPVDVSVDLQTDLAIKLQYVRGNWGVDLGYNFWNRSCENIEFACNCQCPFEENSWALKGDAFMYGYLTVDTPERAPIADSVTALSATQSKATICNGTNNRPDGIDGEKWYANPGVDYKDLAQTPLTNPGPEDQQYRTFPTTPSDEDFADVYTSMQPQFISFCDIDCDAARTQAMSSKIFGSIDYTWRDRKDCERWIPWIGLGFEAEFGHHLFNDGCNQCYQPCSGNEYTCGTKYCSPCNCCNDDCCCQYVPLSQWGIWLKGGIAF